MVHENDIEKQNDTGNLLENTTRINILQNVCIAPNGNIIDAKLTSKNKKQNFAIDNNEVKLVELTSEMTNTVINSPIVSLKTTECNKTSFVLDNSSQVI